MGSRFRPYAWAVAVVAVALSQVGAQPPTLRIGAIVPLTGPAGVSGQFMQKAYELALEEVNRTGVLGRRVELIVENDRGDPPTGAAAYVKLVTRDQVVAVIGGLQSSVSIAVAAQARQRPVLMAWTGAAAVVVEQALADADWFFHYHPWQYHNADSTYRFIRSTGARTIFLAYEDGPFGSSAVDEARAFARQYGLEIVAAEAFKTGSPDLTPLLTKARGSAADVFLFVGFDHDVIPMATQARQLGYSPKMILGSPPSWPVGFEKLPAGNYITGMALWVPSIRHPASQRFVRAYRERFREEPSSYWAPLAYTNLITVAQAIQRARSTELGALVQAMRQTEYDGPIGMRLTFKRSLYGRNQGFTRLMAFQWQNGRQVAVWPEELAEAKLAYPAPWGR
ncbi:Leucine-, isoleucine-, valine-, threonine-, and alanine-binding protein [bacterium HR32]|jgi:branched-chain amino acid transport system substrate-binding protein|nr:Leucine-, isoleucine-, valine-, threonine-, and alanine-binding protein [bacterium HR32]